MNPTVLDTIPLKLNAEKLAKSLHIEDDADLQDFRKLVAAAEEIGRPKAVFRPAEIESRYDDGVVAAGQRLQSRILAVNLQNVHRVFAFVVTCGTELEDWSNTLSDMLERYWADKIKESALAQALKHLSEHLSEHHLPGKTATMNPGSLEDWPMAQQQNLFGMIGSVKELVGVELSDSFLMRPVKSVSGLRFPTESTYENCMLCDRTNCPGRRAKYDYRLYEEKYKKKG